LRSDGFVTRRYRSLFIQARGVLKKELQAHLRTRRTMRRSKNANTIGQKRGQIIDAVSISERPAAVRSVRKTAFGFDLLDAR
jgi:hypothetical protein